MKISVSIIEDDKDIRDVLTEWLSETPDCTCLGSFASAEDALLQLPHDRPDIVLTDINLPGITGIELIRRLKIELPKTEFLILTVYGDTEHIFQALLAGAAGYLLKRSPREELLAAIRLVSLGGSPMSSGLAKLVVLNSQSSAHNAAERLNLTPRESRILDLVARGRLEKQIAGDLQISQHTVHKHIRGIYEKLQVHSRAEAVAEYTGFLSGRRLSGQEK